MAKDLVFKLVMDADVKSFVTNTKQSEATAKSVFESIKQEAEKLRASTAKATEQIGNIIPQGTETLVHALTQSLKEASRIITESGSDAVVAAKNFETLGAKGNQALVQIDRDLIEAKNNLAEFTKTSASPKDIELARQRVQQLELSIDQTHAAFQEFQTVASNANNELNKIGTSANQAAKGAQIAESGFNVLKASLAALGLGVTANELLQTADAYKNLSSRVQIAIGEHGNLSQAMSDVVNIALKTNSDLEATGTLYTKITKAAQDLNKVQQELFSYSNNGTKQLKVNQQDVLQITESLNKATQISGSTAQATEASLYQLGQSLSTGVLRGEEFNSVFEGTPRIMQAIADGLGVSTGQLKNMADAGQLTTNVWLPAFLSQANKLNSEFAKFPLTIGTATNNLKTSWAVYLGELDKTYGISANVAKAIQLISENLGTLASVLKIAAEAAIAYKAIDIAQSLMAKANAANMAKVALATETQAIVANTAANLANANAAKVAAAAHNQVSQSTSGLAPTFTSVTGRVAGFLGRLGTYGAVAGGVVLGGKAIVDSLKETGNWLGESVAKFALHRQGLKTVEEAEAELAAQQKRSKVAAEEAAATKRRDAAAAELAKNAALGLNDASKKVVANFDQQVQSGTKVTEALKGVAEAFSFDSTTGINNGITALMALQAQGKATGEQVKKALSGALDGQDLVVFETNFSTVGAKIQNEMDKTNAELKQKQQAYNDWNKASSNLSYNDWVAQSQKYKDGIAATQAKVSSLQTQYNNTIQGAAMVHGAVLDQAIKRTGISYEELQGKSTKAFVSASNDTNLLIGDLDKLKADGVDTGRLLGSSLGNAINTATNQSELEGLKNKVKGLRGELGEKVTDGLLQQIDQKMIDVKAATDASLPGINSVAEAYKKLGVQTSEQAKVTSQGYIDAFNKMQSSGKATAAQLKQALINMADQIYASGDRGKIAWYENQLAINGLTSKVDEFGKASVSSLNDVSASANSTAQSFSSLGDQAETDADRAASAWEDAADRVDGAKSAMDKKGGGSSDSSSSTGGSVSGLWYTKENVEQKLKDIGYSDTQAYEMSKKLYDQSKGGGALGATRASLSYYARQGIAAADTFGPNMSNTAYIDEQLEKYRDNLMQSKASTEAATAAASNATSSAGPTKTIKLEGPDGQSVPITTPATQADTLESILGQLGRHKRSS
ncbi:tape measure protein [Acinetobacter sp. MD2(2019)]|uniref:tape measure protein n=1 Tax=Acinetobacter sp. MD2(2019) TaxID=2605273 RepID=UPI002D1F791F|nr:tape measure protein [Acinetobacter sp. MD2(2019)]MEB3753822.1 tape measure protein [Acinetobacter sp. MD2(2019)]